MRDFLHGVFQNQLCRHFLSTLSIKIGLLPACDVVLWINAVNLTGKDRETEFLMKIHPMSSNCEGQEFLLWGSHIISVLSVVS